MNVKQRRVIPRLRFRTSSLLWLMVVVAAFFLGQRSDEIATRIARALRTVQQTVGTGKQLDLGSVEQSYHRLIVQQTAGTAKQLDGSMILTVKRPIQKLTNRDPSVASVAFVDDQRVRIVPKLDGDAVVDVLLENGETAQLVISVADGDIVSVDKYLSP